MKIALVLPTILIQSSIVFSQINPSSPTHYIEKKADTIKINNDDSAFIRDADPKLVIVSHGSTSSSDTLKYVFPVVTLILGVAINQVLDRIKARTETKKMGRRWMSELAAMKAPLDTQIQLCDNFLKLYEENPHQENSLSLQLRLKGAAFVPLDKIALVRYLERAKRLKTEGAIDLANRIFNFIDVLAVNVADVEGLFKDNNKQYLTTRQKLFDAVVVFVDEYDKYRYAKGVTSKGDLHPNVAAIFEIIKEVPHSKARTDYPDYVVSKMKEVADFVALAGFSDLTLLPILIHARRCASQAEEVASVILTFGTIVRFARDKFLRSKETLNELLHDTPNQLQ